MLEAKGFLKIVQCACSVVKNDLDALLDDSVDGNQRYSLTVHLSKSPAEIRDVIGFWDVCYGDIRINTATGLAYYRSTRYKSLSTSGLTFKLLIYMVQHAGKKLPILALVDKIEGEAPKASKSSSRDKKKRLEDWMKEIRKHLGITADKNPTITITTIGDNALLISNPPGTKAQSPRK